MQEVEFLRPALPRDDEILGAYAFKILSAKSRLDLGGLDGHELEADVSATAAQARWK